MGWSLLFFIWMSSGSINICWWDCPFSVAFPCPLCQKSIGSIQVRSYVDLVLFPWPTSLYFGQLKTVATVTLYWLWNQAGQVLHLCSSFYILFCLSKTFLLFHINFRISLLIFYIILIGIVLNRRVLLERFAVGIEPPDPWTRCGFPLTGRPAFISAMFYCFSVGGLPHLLVDLFLERQYFWHFYKWDFVLNFTFQLPDARK